jgi:Arc/MetJ family transcription regulator
VRASAVAIGLRCDEETLAAAKRAGGYTTTKEAVNASLRAVASRRIQRSADLDRLAVALERVGVPVDVKEQAHAGLPD